MVHVSKGTMLPSARWPAISPVVLCAGALACSAPAPVPPPKPPRVIEAPEPPASPVPSLPVSAPLVRTDPPVAGPLGTPHPIWVTGHGATGRWISFCQARKDTDGDSRVNVSIGLHGDPHGDAIFPYLKVGSAPEEEVDEVVSADAAGRHLVVVQKGKLVVIDSQTGDRIDLSARAADPAGNSSPLASHGAASLDEAGEHVLFRTTAPSPKLVVLDLASRAEATVDPGAGTLLHAWLDGPWALMVVRVSGAPGRVMTTWAPRRCRGPAASYSVFGSPGTEVRELRVAPLKGGAARTVTGHVATAGDAFVRRDEAGALWLERAAGKPVLLVGAECAARVLGVHRPSGRVLVDCKDGTLSVHDASSHKAIEGVLSDRAPREGEGPKDDADDVRASDEPLAFVYGAESRDLVVDIERGKARSFEFARIKYSDGIVVTRGRRILLRRETSLYLTDFDSDAEHALPGAIEQYPEVRVSGRIAYVEPLVVDIDGAAVLGKTGRGAQVFAVVPTGHVLATPVRTGMYISSAFPDGPVTWTWPADL